MICIFAALLFFLLTVDCIGASDKPIKLRFWLHDSPNSYRVKDIYMVYAKRIQEATKGKVIVEVNAMSPITNARDAHDAAAAGIVDMALCMTGVSPGRYPLLDSLCLPGLGFDSSEMASMAAANLVKKFPIIEKRMGNVKLIEASCTGPDMVGTAKKAIRNIDDFKGMKLRSAGNYQSKLLKNMGAIPVMMGPGDIYSSLQKGVIDGYNMPWGGIRIFKLYEVTGYCLETNNWGGVFFSVMNLDKWNSLPAEVQEQITQASGPEWSRYVGQVTDYNENINRETAKKAGAEIIVPSAKFRQAMLEQCKPLWKLYEEDLKAKGLPGQEVLQANLDFAKEYLKKQK